MSARREKWGLLLVNLGTPDAPHPGPVRRYLREFLNDERVIDISSVGRFFLLNFAILPFRPRKSAEAYRKIWTERGSPLLFHSQDLLQEVRKEVGERFEVALAMRYGNPSIEKGLQELKSKGVERLVLFPLYPQYAASSSGSTLEKVYREIGKAWNVLPMTTVPPFFDRSEFLDAFAEQARPVIASEKADHVLFSFHGLPERHVRKSDETGSHCLASAGCCEAMVPANRDCYRAQSFATARGLASRLKLSPADYSVSFQSRLGRTPWVKPYTDEILPQLAKRGVKRLAVMCPAFVADCLETLEEVGLRAKESFLEAGGTSLVLVPSLNSSPAWVRAVSQFALEVQGAVPGAGRELVGGVSTRA